MEAKKEKKELLVKKLDSKKLEENKGLTVRKVKELLKNHDDSKEVRFLSSSGMEWKLNDKAMALEWIKQGSDKKPEKLTLHIT